MSRLILIITFFIPVALFGQDHSLKGRVIDRTTMQPLRNYSVSIFFENYSNADTIRIPKSYDLENINAKDTFYLKPKLKKIDSTWTDSSGFFKFEKLNSGTYTVRCRIRKVERGYVIDGKENVLVNSDTAFLEFTLRVFCEYDQYKGQDSCPICLKKDFLLKVAYGLPIFSLKDDVLFIGDCEVDIDCMARWYCKKCYKLF